MEASVAQHPVLDPIRHRPCTGQGGVTSDVRTEPLPNPISERLRPAEEPNILCVLMAALAGSEEYRVIERDGELFIGH
jgi:hypothetical protein